MSSYLAHVISPRLSSLHTIHQAGVAVASSSVLGRGLSLASARPFATIPPVSPTSPYKTHQPTPNSPSSPLIHSFFHDPTSTFQFLIVDPKTKAALVVDPALDYDPASGHVSTETASGLIAFVKQSGYSVERVVETHVHADHLSASRVWKKAISNDLPILIGKRVSQVQAQFGPVYNFLPSDFEGSFDYLLEDDEVFKVGDLECSVLHLPGHTPDSVGIKVGDAVFVGDSIFLPDVGSARADFAGGSSSALFTSAQKLLALPDHYRLFSGHDYPLSREKSCFSSVADQRQLNKHVNSRVVAAEFAAMREERDASLGTPRLLHASLQVNLRGGRMPEADELGRRWFRMPISGELDL